MKIPALLFLASIVCFGQGFGGGFSPAQTASSGGTVTEVTGTANQICVATGTTTPVLSICTAFDISGLTSTKPVKTGTAHPATCGVGELFIDTNSTAGQNLELCTATNTWTVISGIGDVVGPGSATDNAIVRFDGTTGKLIQNSAVTIADTTGDIATPGGIDAGVGSGVAGKYDMGAGTSSAIGANRFGIGAPATMTTSVRLESPNALPVDHSLMILGAPASNKATWAYKAVTDCTDTGGNHLNFTQSTDAFSCGTSSAATVVHSFGASFQNNGNAVVAGATGYFTIPYACTIQAWNITATPADTATVDIWKIATGTAVPTVANTITAMAVPAISTGTAVHSTTLTSWTTSVSANDIFGINLKIVGGTATQVTLTVQCQ